MKYFQVFFLLILFSRILAQSISPEVISTAGTLDKQSPASLQWTLGELSVLTFKSEDVKLSEGYNQLFFKEMSTATSTLQLEDEVLLFPNPVIDILHIQTEHTGRIEYVLYNSHGIKLMNGNFNLTTRLNTKQLDVGNYFLVMTTSKGEKGVYPFFNFSK